jgi:hypothetical protein
MFLEFAHIDPHREGGSRETDNLLRLCSAHHVLFDAGRIRFVGWNEDRPSFRDSHGQLLEERASLATPYDAESSSGYDRSGPDAGQVAERPPPAWGKPRDRSAEPLSARL